jgi:hypothetical protein
MSSGHWFDRTCRVNRRVSFKSAVVSLAVLVSLLMPAVAFAAPWPGGSAASEVDELNAFGANVSGLAYQPSGTGTRGVLWAVNNNAILYRLVWNGSIWTPDTANGWAAGKQLRYPGGVGLPDSEGIALAEGDPNGVYVSVERDSNQPATSRPAVLRYDITEAGATLSATREWNLTPDLPGLAANTGLEGVAWVPDSVLVSRGLKDESTGQAYAPAVYPDHGAGLFFVGVEQTGEIVAYALNQSGGTYARVATIASGLPQVMEVTYDPETTHLWAVCDNNCNGQAGILDIAQSGSGAGKFAVTNTFDRPAGMPNLNNEGFAIASQAECVGGQKPVFYSDDDNTGGHVLRQGSLDCVPAPPLTQGRGGSDTTVDGSAKIAKSQKQRGRKIVVRLTVTGGEALAAYAKGVLKAGRTKFPLKSISRSVPAGGAATLELKPAKRRYAAKIAKFLSSGKKAKASVSVTLRDTLGNSKTQSLSAKLRR